MDNSKQKIDKALEMVEEILGWTNDYIRHYNEKEPSNVIDLGTTAFETQKAMLEKIKEVLTS